MTPTGNWRNSIIRFYWDDEATPSVEAPVGDFFCMGWGKYAPVTSLAVVVNPGSAFNCYWPMPFRKKCRITMENIDDEDMVLYYQVDYTLTKVPGDAGYFHAQFRRINPLPYKKDYVLVDSITGQRPVRGYLPGLRLKQKRLVGRGRDQIFYGWRYQVPNHYRYRVRRITSADRMTLTPARSAPDGSEAVEYTPNLAGHTPACRR
jgi:hypothetical protein